MSRHKVSFYLTLISQNQKINCLTSSPLIVAFSFATTGWSVSEVAHAALMSWYNKISSLIAGVSFFVRASVKVAEDDIAFKLAILKKSLHLNDNTCFCSIIQSSKLVLGSLLVKITFLSNFEQKILHPPGWPIVGVAYRRSGPSAAKMQLKRRIRHGPVACG